MSSLGFQQMWSSKGEYDESRPSSSTVVFAHLRATVLFETDSVSMFHCDLATALTLFIITGVKKRDHVKLRRFDVYGQVSLNVYRRLEHQPPLL